MLGLAAITRETVIAEIVNAVIAPAIMGDDPLAWPRRLPLATSPPSYCPIE
jgi:hypothetical protein